MSRRVLIQMDPMSRINPATDSTFILGIEAQRRGYEIYHTLPSDLSLDKSVLYARAGRLTLRQDTADFYTLAAAETMPADAFDLILMRQEPPFDMGYITATYLLEHIMDKTPVINNPISVRDAPEKLLVTHFPDLMPPTLVTRNLEDIRAFRREYSDIVIKPLYGRGGEGVFHVAPDSDNLDVIFEMFHARSPEPVMAQQYLPDIKAGDKRIILIDGKAAGAVNRIPKHGEFRAGLVTGAQAQKTTLTKREEDICAAIGPMLEARGLVFAGIDVIGPYLTEINVTCPTGLQTINRLENIRLEETLWDVFEDKIKTCQKRAQCA